MENGKIQLTRRKMQNLETTTGLRSRSWSGSDQKTCRVKGGREPEMSSKDQIQVVQPKPLRLTSDRLGRGKRKTWNSNTNSETIAVAVAIPTENRRLQQQLQEIKSCNSESDCNFVNQSRIGGSKITPPSIPQVLKKTRSEALKASGAINDRQLRKVKSEDLDPCSLNHPSLNNDSAAAAHSCNIYANNLTLCDSNQIDGQEQSSLLQVVKANDSNKTTQDLAINSISCDDDADADCTDKIKQKAELELTASSSASVIVKAYETQEEIQGSLKEEVIDIKSDHVDRALGPEGEGQLNDHIDSGDGGAADQLIQHHISKKCSPSKTKKVLNPPVTKFIVGLPKSTTSRTPRSFFSTSNSTMTSTITSSSSSSSSSSSTSCGVLYKPTLNSPTFPTTRQEVYYESDVSTTPETHCKLQTLVDIVMWRDVCKSVCIFGIGSFFIISSSYAKDLNVSLISVASYLSLLYLALVFLYKSIINRGVINREDWPENYFWGEEEVVWFVKLVLPFMNESLLKLRIIFSGDPAMTMKLAVVLFVMARCGSSITVWNMMKLGFFGVFVIPKLCSSYSTPMTAYGTFWVGRFRDAWESCSHKKALAFAIFTPVWNYSSIIARAWAVFMLFAAFRYYQQSLVTDEFVEEQSNLHNNVQIRRQLTGRGCRLSTSLDRRKEKKNY